MSSSQTDRVSSAEGEALAQPSKHAKPDSTGVVRQVLTPGDDSKDALAESFTLAELLSLPTTQTNADGEEPVSETLLPLRPTRLRRETKTSLPNISSIDDAFKKLCKEGFSTSQAILSLMKRFKQADLNTFTEKIACSFSNVTYAEIAPLFDLDPTGGAYDMKPLTLRQSRLPTEYIKEVLREVLRSETVYGSLEEHDNEATRVRYLDGLINSIIILFGKKIMNKPEQKLVGGVTNDGAIEYQLVALSSIIVLFIEVKPVQLIGKNLHKAFARVMAESDACDFHNDNNGLWVPIRGILTDGTTLYFFEYRSDTRTWMRTGPQKGLLITSDGMSFAITVRRVSELLYDFLLMGYIDGLEAFYHRSIARSRKPNSQGVRAKRDSTPRWEASLEGAKTALKSAREAHEMIVRFSSKQKRSLNDTENPKDDVKQVILEANTLAGDALEYLNKSIANAPSIEGPLPRIRPGEYDELTLELGLDLEL